MNIIEKIMSIYPELTMLDLTTFINLQDNLDGKGAYIAMWNHPTLTKPTDEQMSAT
jgi:hypothetical protein